MYQSRRRPWVKLYCRDWLTSTVRFVLTPTDRSVFIDLLAMAGDSRFPGIVAAGYEADKDSHLLGYPIDWLAAQMGCPAPDLLSSLRKLEAQGRVSLEEYCDTFIIRICSWDKYQSDYLRQIQRFAADVPTSVSSQQKLIPTSAMSSDTEGEGDVEVEGEKPTLTSFASFWSAYPKGRKVGKPEAQRAWRKVKGSEVQAVMVGLERWKKTEQWTKGGGRYVPYPATFLNQRRWEDEPTNNDDFDDRFDRAVKKKP